jgi:alkyl sulfatase BDS1-like metallo-beta-lactamase superfamily hydrolase
MNRGMSENEVVDFVQLPKHLEENPYLKQFYGTVPWSVRSIFNGYLGWFGGDAVTLDQLSDQARSERFVAALASDLTLEGQVRQAIQEGDLLWAAELSDHLLRTDPKSKTAKALKAQVLRSLGEQHISANGRHYYIAQATETLGDPGYVRVDRSKVPDDFVADLKMSTLMGALPSKLKAEKTLDMDQVVLFKFTDTGETYSFHVRRGIVEMSRNAPEAPDMTISVSEVIWKDIIFQKRSPALAFASGDIDVDGGIIRVVRFLGLFET